MYILLGVGQGGGETPLLSTYFHLFLTITRVSTKPIITLCFAIRVLNPYKIPGIIPDILPLFYALHSGPVPGLCKLLRTRR
jgi:hypothetical protein